MTTEQHETTVVERGSTLSPMFQAWCDDCGGIGEWQEYEADAGAIARHHHDIGGFEPRHGGETR